MTDPVSDKVTAVPEIFVLSIAADAFISALTIAPSTIFADVIELSATIVFRPVTVAPEKSTVPVNVGEALVA